MTEPPTTRPMSSYASYSEPAARPSAPMSGLTEDEARGFHGMFITSFIGFTIIAAIAHFAVWQWRPWIPGVAGYETRTAQTAPAIAPATVASNVQR